MSKFTSEVAAGNLGSELTAWVESDIGQTADTIALVAGMATVGVLAAPVLGVGTLVAGIGGGVIGLDAGIKIAEATDTATAADRVKDQDSADAALALTQADADKTALKVRQDENETQLLTNQLNERTLLTDQQKATSDLAIKKQGEDLASYGGQQALEEQSQSEAERAAYLSANYQLRGAQEQIGAQRAQAQGGASTLIANAANRGLKVGEGAVKSGQDIAKGNITTNPDGSVSYAAAPVNIYDPETSPLMQLAVYERSANRQIAAQGLATEGASNLATGEIASGTRQFNAQQGQNLSAFTLGQAQNMEALVLGQGQNMESLLANQGENLSNTKLAHKQGLESAQLSYNQMQETILQDQAFTETNLQEYKSSLWLQAFSNIVNQGASLLGKLYTPKQASPKKAETASYDNFNYDSYMGLNYYTPGVR